MTGTSYEQIEDGLREQATECVTKSRATTSPLERREWLEAASCALSGRRSPSGARRRHGQPSSLTEPRNDHHERPWRSHLRRSCR